MREHYFDIAFNVHKTFLATLKTLDVIIFFALH